jgi:hypothetical protein
MSTVPEEASFWLRFGNWQNHSRSTTQLHPK